VVTSGRRWLAVSLVLAAFATACGTTARDGASRGVPTVTTTTPTGPATTAATTPAGPTRVLVVGDSLALLLSSGLDRRGARQGWDVEGAGVLGCGILPGVSLRYGEAVSVDDRCGFVPDLWRTKLDEFDPDAIVVLDGYWDAYDWVIDGVPVAFGTAAWDAFAREHFGAAMDLLSSGGRRVLWLLAPYFRPDEIDPVIEQYRREHGEYRSALDDDRVRHLNDLFRDVASERGCAVTVVDSRPCICPDDQYADTIDGFDVRGDGVHLTDAGADRLADFIIPRVELALGAVC
jgi:hypothetical protein